MKPKIGLITLLLVLCCQISLVCASEVRQVVYELELIGLSQSDAAILGITLPEPIDLLQEGIESISRLIHSPNLTSILRAGVELLQITATRERIQNVSLAQPQIAISLGQTGKFALSTEEWLINKSEKTYEPHSYGLSLVLTPVRLSTEGNQVFTTVEVGASGPTQLLTSVWTECGETAPLGVLSFTQASQGNSTLWEQRQSETRYFAVYLTAHAVRELPEERAIKIGSLGGLEPLLWPAKTEAQPSSISLSVPFTPLKPPELELKWWLSTKTKLELHTISDPKVFAVELGFPLVDQDLLLRGGLLVFDSTTYLAVGLSDRVRINHALTFSAGVLPIMVNLSEQKLERIMPWWVEAELETDRIFAGARYWSLAKTHLLEGSLGYKLTPQDLLFVRYRTDLTRHQVALGYRREF